MSEASSETTPRLPVIYWVGCAALVLPVVLRALDVIAIAAAGSSGMGRQVVAALVGIAAIVGLFSRKVSSFRWAKFLLAATGGFGIFVAFVNYQMAKDQVDVLVAGANGFLGIACIGVWLLMEMQSYKIENALNPN